MNSKNHDVKTFAQGKTFTTEPKLRKITWHKLRTVRTRACALQESFYPTTDIPYNAAKTRLITLLGICDRMSILAYLGRPEHRTEQVMDHTKKYNNSGKTIPITHYFRRKLPAKKGYIELFNLGYVYEKDGEWWIHWNHDIPVVNEVFRRSQTESEEGGVSKVDFSLSYNTSKGNTKGTLSNQCELDSSRVREKRESVLCEREICFCVKSVKNEPSYRDAKGRWLSKGELRVLQSASKEGDSHG
jgi:hypothetical protein